MLIDKIEDEDCGCDFAAAYLCSLLGHFHQGVELVSNPRQCGLLKQTLLSLSKHQPNQHTEHGWTHVIAGSVGECFLKVVQNTWVERERELSTPQNQTTAT